MEVILMIKDGNDRCPVTSNMLQLVATGNMYIKETVELGGITANISESYHTAPPEAALGCTVDYCANLISRNCHWNS
jgi:hypothetical protein